MVELPDMPASIAALPRDHRNYPVPWFVAWVDGKPEFRVADGEKWVKAVRKKLCWVCGEKLDPRQHVFPIGPMCALNHITSEPRRVCRVLGQGMPVPVYAQGCQARRQHARHQRESGWHDDHAQSWRDVPVVLPRVRSDR